MRKATQDWELKRNGSGYFDPTAYEAIKNTRGGVSVNGDTINAGEVWQFATTQGIREILTIQVFNNYAVGLMLVDNPPAENGIRVRSRSMMYADAGRLTYAYYDKFTEFVRATSDDELGHVLDTVTDLLDLNRFRGGVSPDTPGEPPVEAQAAPSDNLVDIEEVKVRESEIRELKRALEAAVHDADTLRAECAAGDRALTCAQQEKAIFERLYHEMLDRLLDK